eukprot:gb/GECG01016256.1/.p1 GENE.gb/GECG01016256.1/~~gb/GECG01016256.1/.p1  ORF type:complete len:366 (+),score=31.96 gb/GECG01016256.1/:1-1098(+)
MSRKRKAPISQENIFQGFEYGNEPQEGRSKTSRTTDRKIEDQRKSNTLNDVARVASPRIGSRDGKLHFPLCAALRKPYITHKQGGWFRERFSSVCHDCFTRKIHCDHYPEIPLRLILVGHNPSEKAWEKGYYYANPGNAFMKLMRNDADADEHDSPRVIPSHWPLESQDSWPAVFGVGLTDMGTSPGNDSASFRKNTLAEWREDLLQRLQAHADRVYANVNNPNYLQNSISFIQDFQSRFLTEKSTTATYDKGKFQPVEEHYHQGESNCIERLIPKDQCGPRVVAFTGKSQFYSMYGPEDPKPPSKLAGRVPHNILPKRWPFPKSTEVFVLISSSGRASGWHKERKRLYDELAELVNQHPWPPAL